MDLIADLIAGRLTKTEADRALERLQERWRQDGLDDWMAEAGMTLAESTAFLHGAGLGVLARWRASGWPDTCCRCAGPLDHQGGSWLVAFVGAEERAVLRHLDCPRPALQQPICPTDPDVTMHSSVFEDARFRSASRELESVLRRMADGELDASHVIGYIESAYVETVIQATVDAYEQVYGRSPRRQLDDESPST